VKASEKMTDLLIFCLFLYSLLTTDPDPSNTAFRGGGWVGGRGRGRRGVPSFTFHLQTKDRPPTLSRHRTLRCVFFARAFFHNREAEIFYRGSGASLQNKSGAHLMHLQDTFCFVISVTFEKLNFNYFLMNILKIP
jgi:hypothetical protein